MEPLLELTETPVADEMYLLAGWRQWADAGSVSSELPQYLIDRLGARKIGRIRDDGFYLFQIPGTHHFLRPEIKLEDGYRKELRLNRNDLYYWGNERKGLVIFQGDEPHLRAERYAEAFFDAAQTLGVRRVVGLGGVYGPSPYDKGRHISCTYSLKQMKDELSRYAVLFSNYEGGVSLGSYLTDRAEQVGMEYVSMYAFVPMYDLSDLNPRLQGITVEEDYRAWYDILQRVDYMLGLGLDLSDLERQSEELTRSITLKFEELQRKMPKVDFDDYLHKVNENFVEMPFVPLDDVWGRELGDILKDLDV